MIDPMREWENLKRNKESPVSLVSPVSEGDETPSITVTEDIGIPPRPAGRPGIVAELMLKDEAWTWVQRPIDAAHRAWLAYRENSGPDLAATPRESMGREPDRDEDGATAVERAAAWRSEWEVTGYPPGVRKDPK